MSKVTTEDIENIDSLLKLTPLLQELRKQFVNNHGRCPFTCLELIPTEEDIIHKQTQLESLKYVALKIKKFQVHCPFPAFCELIRQSTVDVTEDLETLRGKLDEIANFHIVGLKERIKIKEKKKVLFIFSITFV